VGPTKAQQDSAALKAFAIAGYFALGRYPHSTSQSGPTAARPTLLEKVVALGFGFYDWARLLFDCCIFWHISVTTAVQASIAL
jgi:hypothetical protein